MCKHVYISTYKQRIIHIHAHTYVYTHIHIPHTCTYVHMWAWTNAHSCSHSVHTCTCICIWEHMCIYTHMLSHTQRYFQVHTHAHMNIYLSICTHMQTCKIAMQDIWQCFFPVFSQISLGVFVMSTEGVRICPRPMCIVPIVTQLQQYFFSFSSTGNKPRTLCMLHKAFYHWATSPVLLFEFKITEFWGIYFLFWLKYNNINSKSAKVLENSSNMGFLEASNILLTILESEECLQVMDVSLV